MDQSEAVDLFVQMPEVIPVLVKLFLHPPELDRLTFQLNIDYGVFTYPEEVEFFSDLRDRKRVEPSLIGMGSRAAERELIHDVPDHFNLFGPALYCFIAT